jgi:hypothetical protein
MYISVRDILDDNTREWSSIPILNDLKIEFDDVVSCISQVSELKKAQKTYMPEKKDKIRKQLADKTLIISGALEAYSSIIEDEMLKEIVALKRIDIARARDIELEALILPVIEEAKARKQELVNFGITNSVIRDLEKTLNNYLHMVGITNRYNINEPHNADELNLDNLFIRGDYLLGVKMDKLMIQFKNPNPEFYSEYLCARVIVDN